MKSSVLQHPKSGFLLELVTSPPILKHQPQRKHQAEMLLVQMSTWNNNTWNQIHDETLDLINQSVITVAGVEAAPSSGFDAAAGHSCIFSRSPGSLLTVADVGDGGEHAEKLPRLNGTLKGWRKARAGASILGLHAYLSGQCSTRTSDPNE